MTLGTVSVCMTVLILNVHHRGARCPVPVWLHRFCFQYVARLVCLQTNHKTIGQNKRRLERAAKDKYTSDDTYNSTSSTDSVWKRRSTRRQATIPATVDNNNVGRNHSTDCNLMTTSNRPVSAWSIVTAKLLSSHSSVNDFNCLQSNSRRQRQPEITDSYNGNGGHCAGYCVVGDRHSKLSKSNGIYSSTLSRKDMSPVGKTTSQPRVVSDNEEFNSPLLYKKQTHSVDTATNCSREAACHKEDSSFAASVPTSSSVKIDCGVKDEDDDDVEDVAREWREIARVLDRLCFWTLLILMTASGFIILLYPKYTGNETDWEAE